MKSLHGPLFFSRPLLAIVCLVATVLSFGVFATAARGQALEEFDHSRELRTFGVNALLGGVSAGVAALIRDEPVVEAIAKGLAGGTLVYGGKRIGAETAWGAGVVGRQLASVGGSIVGNQVAGRRTFDRIALAWGPLRAWVGTAVDGVDWRLDGPAAGAILFGLMDGGRVDPGLSLSRGAVVIENSLWGNAFPGTVFDETIGSDYVLSHEQIHVIQFDQLFLFWGEPLESWLALRAPELGGLFEHVEFNAPLLGAAAFMGLVVWEEREEQFWETEAQYLGHTR